ncbi:hypothetical protein PUN28_020177 [Cardiocondyla obscurior]|uniref:Uncharacterized protein n=1 Tax=Cardiocondyla obscurior TaxID=286306 RepID=A0AAW2EAS6_9HYME
MDAQTCALTICNFVPQVLRRRAIKLLSHIDLYTCTNIVSDIITLIHPINGSVRRPISRETFSCRTIDSISSILTILT